MAAPAIINDKSLGVGLYSPAEAALFARLRASTMKRWVFGGHDGDAAITHQITSDSPVVSFIDLVQSLAIHSIRSSFAVPLQRIRAAVDRAENTYGIQYPFARSHKTFVITEGSAKGNIAIKVENRVIQVTGKNRDQVLMEPVIEPYLKQIKFGPDGLAYEYTAWKSPSGVIRMNPHIRFGQPMVVDCGISARVLWEAVGIEGGIKEAAKAYGVRQKHIRLACEYFGYLTSGAAA